jgi:hypothetical protein
VAFLSRLRKPRIKGGEAGHRDGKIALLSAIQRCQLRHYVLRMSATRKTFFYSIWSTTLRENRLRPLDLEEETWLPLTLAPMEGFPTKDLGVAELT